ncbi:MAG: hypothetical protein ACFFBD_15250, partial [Candidatus Hodarchaeota archaeon]
MDIFNYIQLVLLFLLYVIFIGNTLLLKIKANVNSFVLGRGKKGFKFILELIFVIILLVWSFEVLVYSLNLPFKLFPFPLDIS